MNSLKIQSLLELSMIRGSVIMIRQWTRYGHPLVNVCPYTAGQYLKSKFALKVINNLKGKKSKTAQAIKSIHLNQNKGFGLSEPTFDFIYRSDIWIQPSFLGLLFLSLTLNLISTPLWRNREPLLAVLLVALYRHSCKRLAKARSVYTLPYRYFWRKVVPYNLIRVNLNGQKLKVKFLEIWHLYFRCAVD